VVYEKWFECACNKIETYQKEQALNDLESHRNDFQSEDVVINRDTAENNSNKENSLLPSSSSSSSFLMLKGSTSEGRGGLSNNLPDVQSDDDLEFFDCEEEAVGLLSRGNNPLKSSSIAADFERSRYGNAAGFPINEYLQEAQRSSLTSSSSSSLAHTEAYGEETHLSSSTAKDIAVSLVEMVFVLSEFSYWKVSYIRKCICISFFCSHMLYFY
jgi:hypothetical protein